MNKLVKVQSMVCSDFSESWYSLLRNKSSKSIWGESAHHWWLMDEMCTKLLQAQVLFCSERIMGNLGQLLGVRLSNPILAHGCTAGQNFAWQKERWSAMLFPDQPSRALRHAQKHWTLHHHPSIVPSKIIILLHCRTYLLYYCSIYTFALPALVLISLMNPPSPFRQHSINYDLKFIGKCLFCMLIYCHAN